jgi:hypothetical protein
MEMTDKIQIILHEIAFEGFQRQSPIPHGQDKRVVDESVPDRGDIWMF